MMDRPVLVNGDCEVLRGQVLRANGGLYYRRYEEFAAAMDLLVSEPGLADRLGRQGHAYFEANYAWDRVMEKYERLLALRRRGPGAPAEARLRHPALRPGGERRGGDALPAPGRAPGAAAPGRGVRHPRPRLPRVEEPLPEGHRGGERPPRPPLDRAADAQRARLRLLSNLCFHETHTREEEEAWVRENGPFSPDLVKAVAAARGRFDRFLFYCYRYYHTYHGLPAVGTGRSSCPPRRRTRPSTSGSSSRSSTRRAGIVYLTPEEQALVEDASGNRAVRERRDRQRPRTSRADPGLRRPGEARPHAALRPLRRPHRPEQGRSTPVAYFRKLPRGGRPGRGPRAGREDGGAHPRPPAHPRTSASSPRRRRWRRSSGAGFS